MKKLIAVLLSFILVFSHTGIVMAEDTGNSESVEETSVNRSTKTMISDEWEGITWTFSDGVLTVDAIGSMKEADRGYYPWSGLAVEKVIVGEGITEIGMFAFSEKLATYEGATKQHTLKSVVLPESLTKIGTGAFEHCTLLEEIDIPDSVTEIWAGAFSGCTSLKSFDFPDEVTEVNWGMFSECTALESVKLPENLTKIHTQAFSKCCNLKEIILPDSLTYIDSWAFYHCCALQNVVIPDKVTFIGASSFDYCPSLTDIYIPESVEEFGSAVFGSWGNNNLIIHGIADSVANEYADSYNIEFRDVNKKYLDEGATVTLPYKSYTYTGKAITPVPTVKYNGVTLKKGTDYTVEYKYNIVPSSQATVIINGTGTYAGTVTKTFTIKKRPMSKLTITVVDAPLTYTGKAQEAYVQVKNGSNTLWSDWDYTVTYKNNKNVGTATATVKAASDSYYTGTATVKFKIIPKPTTVTKLTAAKKAFTVKWTKKTTQTTGYRICYSTSSSFKNAKYKMITSYKTTSKKITGLSAKKTYYVKIQTYKTVNGVKYYSKWSAAKKIKTK